MHETRNVLYQIKKDSSKRSSPLYEPDPERDDLRAELASLRTQLRSKDTEILRLHAQLDDLRRRITLFEANSKLSSQSSEHQLQGFSEVPMMLELRELREQSEGLHRENLALNGNRNELEGELRAARGELARQGTQLRELEVLERMREERFKDEVARLTPIIVEENKDFSYIKEGVLKTAAFLREHAFTVAFELFLRCAKECDREKKVSSFSIFRNCWAELKSARALGFQAALRAYEVVRKVAGTLEEGFCGVEEGARDTMNQWVMDTLLEIGHSGGAKEKEQKLFRMLGLYYRSKFPIKGERFELDDDVRGHF
jgi:uncharacterized coiled-coil DUF342 family protein